MWMAHDIMADGGNDMGQLLYVIAFLILAGIGSVFEKIKKHQENAKRGRAPSPPPVDHEVVPPPITERRPDIMQPPVRRETSEPVVRPARTEMRRPPVAAPGRPRVPRSVTAKAPQRQPTTPPPAPQALERSQPLLSDVLIPKRRISARAKLGPLDRAQLRRAIVLSEILQPPVALREP